MLTIEIPKSNRRKSEEDALASFSLSEIKEKGECVYFHYGVGWEITGLIVGQKILEVTLKTDTKFRSWRTIMS